jgi:hypothetical protein
MREIGLRFLASIAVAGMLVAQACATPAPDAQTPPATATIGAQANVSPSTQTADKDPTECRVLPPPTGSRLGSRKICQKKSVWDQLRQDSSDATSKAQKAGDLARSPGS